jgi:organic radical activating enzyme
MKIHNLRLGFATNSSSSHSIIFDSELASKVYDNHDDDFGWDYFTITSRESKELYFASMLYHSIIRTTKSSLFASVILKGIGVSDDTITMLSNGYGDVDHQSNITFPFEYGTKDTIDLDFAKDLIAYMKQHGFIILGGNDNNDEPHRLFDETKKYKDLDTFIDRGTPFYCRKDGDWWTLYNKENGNRLTISFIENPEPYEPKTPVLVDFKISSYCTMGCQFCYTNSTKNDKHMDKNNIYSYVKALTETKVFEVAIGGGEPTQCPHLDSFIEYCNWNGIVVNFTTKDSSWLSDKELAYNRLSKIGAFAYSVDNNTDISELKSISDRITDMVSGNNLLFYKWKSKFTIQMIPAIMEESKMREILSWASSNYIRVTLLGYKESGRGDVYKNYLIKKNLFDEDKWIRIVQELSSNNNMPSFAIDTTLAAKYKEELKNIDIPDCLYHIEEGKYSLFIDGVKNLYGPSSYHMNHLVQLSEKDIYNDNWIIEKFSGVNYV